MKVELPKNYRRTNNELTKASSLCESLASLEWGLLRERKVTLKITAATPKITAVTPKIMKAAPKITGEYLRLCLRLQTLQQKLVAGLASRCRIHNEEGTVIPCWRRNPRELTEEPLAESDKRWLRKYAQAFFEQRPCSVGFGVPTLLRHFTNSGGMFWERFLLGELGESLTLEI